jgi:hypothetical protein
MSLMNGPASDDDLYDFAPETSPAPPQTKLIPPAVVKPDTPQVLSYRALKNDKPLPLETEAIKNVYLPLGILAGGIVIEILSSIIWTHQVAATFAELAVDLTLGTAVMLAAMLIATKIRGIHLGNLGVAAYKLAAISIGPAAVMEFITPIARYIPFGWLICLIVEFILFFALLGALFDLDESDTWYCVLTMFFTRIAFYFLLQAIFHR